MTALLLVIAAVYGLIIGSFLNAWAWRLAHGEKITAGRSACPHCHHQIRAYDNIPVVSWLLLRGRCRDCGAPISWRYPVGEALTAVLFVAVAVYDGPSLLLIPHLLFVSAMVLVSQVDLEIRIIPDVLILPVAANQRGSIGRLCSEPVATRQAQHGLQGKDEVKAQERVEAPPQMNPFAKAQREGKA